MTESIVAYTSHSESRAAGSDLGGTIADAFGGEPADAVIVFASPRYPYSPLLEALSAECRPRVLVGCSSAGEFINAQLGEQSACAIALRSDEIHFAAGLGRRLSDGMERAADEIAASFAGIDAQPALFHSALVLADPLVGRTDELTEVLNLRTGGTYRFFGGGAGDDARFEQTHVFYGTEAFSDAAVALEILSRKPLGIGVQHGWAPAGPPLRVTETDGMRLVSLNAAPAVEAFEEYAATAGQTFDREAPLSFFLHNVIGIESGDGYRLRVPLAVNDDGSITCAAEVPEGVLVHIMRATVASASEATTIATESAISQLEGNTPEVALFFDCVATRLRMGTDFEMELQALADTLGEAKYAGCNTYGQIARVPGQFSGFHNCTAVVCVIPK